MTGIFSLRTLKPALCTLTASLFIILLGNGFATEVDEYEQSRKEIISFQVDYKESCSDLCLMGAAFDTDKSSQRTNASNSRHSHPYTLFYNSIFRDKKEAELAIAEVGIEYGASLLMWRDYFENATIYGFEYNVDYINSFKSHFNNDRIELAEINVRDQASIQNAFQSVGIQYDLIIDDSTHQFEDQLRIIENVHQYLKPGGMLIIEDVFKSYKEQDYIDRLKPILELFQDYYFVSMDHVNRNSSGWDNDKVLVLVKGGDEPIFRNKKKITIITPSMRPENLHALKESIDFSYVNEWIIVYDGNRLPENPLLFADEGNVKIKEYIHKGNGISGNPQRNYALDHIENEDTYLYFLDDDNVIHKDLYRLLDIIDEGSLYTFDQANRMPGNRIEVGNIDTAMFLVDFKLCKDVRWASNDYVADGMYIRDCLSINKDKWIYVNNTLCTYNKL